MKNFIKLCFLTLFAIWSIVFYYKFANSKESQIIGGVAGAIGGVGSTGQFKGLSEIGVLSDDINLFTGDVSFSLPLVSLPGRSGLDIGINLTYNSNVHNILDAENKYIQASWVGLGWNLTFGYIKADLRGTTDIYDDKYFYVTEDGNTLELVQISDSQFVTTNYKFWKIIRYDTTSGALNFVKGWRVTREDGTIFEYGDFQIGYGTQKANRCRLRWSNYVGDGIINDDSLVVYQWDLAKVKNSAKTDSLVFKYFQEQERIGTGPDSSVNKYTKASYLDTLIDAIGRKIIFGLENRATWEYFDGYTYQSEPDWFHEFYETKRLKSISVRDNQNNLFYRLLFSYDSNGVGAAKKKKALLSQIDEEAFNIAAIGVSTGDSLRLPSISFVYDTASTAANRGALKEIRYPQGGKTTYNYTSLNVDHSKLSDSVGFNNVRKVHSNAGFNVYGTTKNVAGEDTLFAYSWQGKWDTAKTPYWQLGGVEGYEILASGVNYFALIDYSETYPVIVARWKDGYWDYDTLAGIASGGGIEFMQSWSSDDFFLTAIKFLGGGNIYYFACHWIEKDSAKGYWEVDTLDVWGGSSDVKLGKNMAILHRPFTSQNNRTKFCYWTGSVWDTLVIAPGSPSSVGYTIIGEDYGALIINDIMWTRRWMGKYASPKWKPQDFDFLDDYVSAWPGPDFIVIRRIYDGGSGFGSLEVIRWNGNQWVTQVINNNIYANVQTSVATTMNSFVAHYRDLDGGGLIYLDTLAWFRWQGNTWQKYLLHTSGWTNDWLYQGSFLSIFNDVATGFYKYYGGTTSLRAYRLFGDTLTNVQLLANYGFHDSTKLTTGKNYIAILQKPASDMRVFKWNEGDNKWDTTLAIDKDDITVDSLYPQLYTYPDNFSLLREVEDKIYFYKWSGEKCTTSVKDFPITSKIVNDRFGNVDTTLYEYYDGLYDPSNNFAKYNKVKVIPPAATANGNGYIFHYFYNDLDSSRDGSQFRNLNNTSLGIGRALDGLPYKIEYFNSNNVKVAVDSNYWKAVEKYAESYWIRLDSTEKTIDGVLSKSKLFYNPNTKNGLPDSTKDYGSDGRVRVTNTTYAHQIYSAMDTKNMLIQVYKQTIKDSTAGKSLSSTKTVWSNQYGNTELWVPRSNWTWKDAYPTDGIIDSVEYAKIDSIYNYDNYGNILQMSDANGNLTSFKYDSINSVPVMEVSGAKYDQISYYDLEQGKSFDSWSINYDSVKSEIKHTGSNSCVVRSTGSFQAGPTKSFAAGTPQGTYVLSGWVLCDQVGKAKLKLGNSQVTNQTIGDWEYLEVSYYYSGSGGFACSCRVEPTNARAYFDDLRVYPSDALVSTKTFERGNYSITSTTDANNTSIISLPDYFGRPVESKTNLNKFLSSNWFYYSSYHHASTYDSTDPNHAGVKTFPNLTNLVLNGGFEAGFKNWIPARVADWSGSTPTLYGQSIWDLEYEGNYAAKLMKYSGNAAGIAFKSKVVVKPGQKYYLKFFAFYPTSLNVLLRVYDKKENDSTSTTNISGWTYNSTYQALSQTISSGSSYTPYTFSCSLTSNIYFVQIAFENSSPFATYIDNIYLYPSTADPDQNFVSKTFFDGLGRKMQTRTKNMEGATDKALVSSVRYDELGRTIRQFKNYVDLVSPQSVNDFTPTWNVANNDSSEAKSYYDSDGPGADCGGYPFTETRYLNDPLGRADTVGSPGSVFRIGAGHEISATYSKNGVSEIPGYSAGTLFKLTAKDENAHKVQQFTDKFGNTVAIVADSGGLNHITLNKYDLLGNLLKVVPPKANQDSTSVLNSVYHYNTLGQIDSSYTPDDSVKKSIYDLNGNLRYSQNQVQRRTGGGHFTVRKYDKFNRLIFVGEEKDQSYNWINTFPPLDDITFGEEPGEWRIRYFYDSDEIGQGINYSKGRLTKVEVNWDSLDFYDLLEYLEKYKYDEFGRVIQKVYNFAYDYGADSIFYQYNNLGQLTRIIYPNLDTVTYSYDSAGRLNKVGRPSISDKYATYSYYANGVDSVIFHTPSSPAQKLNYKYHPRDWLTFINNGSVVSNDTGSGDHFGLRLVYDNWESGLMIPQYNGNIARAVSKISAASSADSLKFNIYYDAINRMLYTNELINGTAHDEVFYYDKNGNLDTLKRAGTPRAYNYYSNTNRVSYVTNLSPPQSANNYSYDKNGNITGDSSNVRTLSYDYRNLLTKVVLRGPSDGVLDTFFFYYDAEGKRIKKHWIDNTSLQTNIYTTYYVYSGNGVIAEYDKNNVLTANYVYAGGERIAMRTGTPLKNYFYLKDHLGSTRVIVDSTGRVQAKYNYYPFGELLNSTVTVGSDFKYTGKEFDEESNFNLYCYSARFYDPKLARWCSVDPVKQGFSPYVFVGNNPIIYIDRDGKIFGLPFLLSAILIGTVTGAAVGATYAAITDQNIWEGMAWGAAAGAFVGLGVGAGGAVGSAVGNAVADALTSGANPSEMWKYSLVGFATGYFAATGGLGLAKNGLFGSRLAGRLGTQVISTSSRSIGTNIIEGRPAFSSVKLGVGPITLRVGKGQRLWNWSDNWAFVAGNVLGGINDLAGGKSKFNKNSLSFTFSGGPLGPISGIFTSRPGFTHLATSWMLNPDDLSTFTHEGFHVWQQRFFSGWGFYGAYILRGINAELKGGEFFEEGNYLEDHAADF